MADSAKLKKAIGEILDDADLNTITAKKVRQQLETKLKTDLTDRKKEIDEMVMEVLEQKQDQGKSDDEASEDEGKKSGGKRRKHDSDSEDEVVPEKKSKGKAKKAADSDEDSDDWAKKKKTASKKGAAAAGGKKKGGTGFTKIMKLSPELSSVMGQPEMARHEVVKKVWSIIKERNLYDPKNKQFAICDTELLPVFGVKRFRTFGMMKHLKNHFLPD